MRRHARFARPSVVLGFLAAAAVPPAAGAAQGAIDVPPARLPPTGASEIAQHGGHLTWQDTLTAADGRKVPVVLDRAGGRTVALPLAPVRDLDIGPGPDGSPTAVYVRCAPSCDIWRYDYARRSEQRVRSISAPGLSEHLPTIWGRRIAFERRGSVIVADLGANRSRTVARRVFPDDIELGAKHVAYVGLFDRGEGNGTVELRLRGLESRREQLLGDGVIGEGSSTGFGGLTFQGGTLFWQVRRRSGCRVSAPLYGRYDIRRGGGARPAQPAAAPQAVRSRALVPPGTPESESC
jgi:hypothetical protein